MRIITGTARGAKLETLDGEATRPTAERTKQAIFNILQFDIEGRSVLDLFGGSGQLALEALSRGASGAYVCDSNPEACEIIKRNARKTHLFEKMRVVCNDYKATLKSLSGREKFDIVFLDPPYGSDAVSISLHRLSEGALVRDGGFIVIESDSSTAFSQEGFTLVKHSKYGRAFVTVLEKNISSDNLSKEGNI